MIAARKAVHSGLSFEQVAKEAGSQDVEDWDEEELEGEPYLEPSKQFEEIYYVTTNVPLMRKRYAVR